MMNPNLWTASYFEENREQCLSMLKDQQFVNQIPPLNVTSNCEALNKKLVRFKGMIQDVLNPVYFLEKFKVRDITTETVFYRSGKYCDSFDIEETEEVIRDGSENMLQEKQVIHCVQIPGLNSWAKQFKFVDDQSSSGTANRVGKRKFESDTNDMDLDDGVLNEGSTCYKKFLTEEKKVEYDKSEEAHPSEANPELNNTSSFISSETSNSEGITGLLLNVYDGDNLKLQVNETVEAIGFLSLTADVNTLEENSYYNAIPKMHVIDWTCTSSMFDSLEKMHKNYVFSNALSLRDDLWIMLTDLLLGDTLAADYLICHLISSVYLRKDSLALGKFTLNISNVSSQLAGFEYVSALYNFLAHLLERSVYLPLTIVNLNTISLIPKQNNDENRLISGLLQVPKRTHFIIDETNLEPGHLIDTGVRNMQALSDVITMQKLEYDFEFYKLPFETDISLLTLSREKSLLPNDVHLVLDPDDSCVQNVSEAFSRAWQKMTDPLLSKLRVYLNNISSLNYCISVEMQQTIERDFVRMRQDATNRASINDLHRLMVLSRLMTISKGFNSLSKDVWDYTCQMEVQRKARS